MEIGRPMPKINADFILHTNQRTRVVIGRHTPKMLTLISYCTPARVYAWSEDGPCQRHSLWFHIAHQTEDMRGHRAAHAKDINADFILRTSQRKCVVIMRPMPKILTLISYCTPARGYA